MGSFRLRGCSLAVAALVLWGCGSGDSGGLIGGNPGTDAGESGGKSNSSAGGGGGGGAKADTGGTSGTTSAGGASAGGSTGADTGGADSSGGAGGAATDAGQGGAGGATPVKCGSVTCDPAATCTSGKCVCPSGTTDKNADGTECTNDDGGSCSSDDECTNGHCVGGSCCAVACTTPGACEKQAGTVCASGTTCQYGKLADKTSCDDGNACTTNTCFNGKCGVDSSKNCDDTDKCTNDTCDGTTGACVHTATVCNDNNPCTTDTCVAATGCTYAPNTAACDDGDKCTTLDVCTGGACKGKATDCSGLTNTCAAGACVAATGLCAATPKNLNGVCSNGISACDATGACNAAGVCVGDNKACGAIATACVTCASGVQCFGAPTGHDCTCPPTSSGTPVVEQNGKCVLNNDECIANPCGPFATACNDPTPSAVPAHDYVCTCGPGTVGNTVGTACVDKNECAAATNPCGNGTCTNANPPTKYTCACAAGFKSTPTATGPVCACDMSGTFVEAVVTNVSWANIGGGAIANPPAGGVPTYGWSLRQQTVAADGTMTAVTVPCGGMAPTLCDTSTNHLAYAQYQPVSSWGKSKMRSGFPVIGPINVATTVPGGSYGEPQTSAILGLDLKDPAGEWPPCRACIGPSKTTCVCGGVTHNITNPSTWWSNAEGTNKLGVTTIAVRQGGDVIGDATLPDPPINYGVPSECPRPAGGSDYNAWPGIAFPSIFSTYQWYGASRITSGLASTSISAACVITGTVTGPDAGSDQVGGAGPGVQAKVPHSDARIVGCEKGTNAAPTGACLEPTAQAPTNPDEVGFYDGVAQTQSIVKSTFTLARPPASITPAIDLGAILAMADGAPKETAINNACQAVRSSATYCPPGRVCK